MSEVDKNEIGEWIQDLYALSAFLVGNGDVCEIAANRLRVLARRIERVSGLEPEEEEAV